MYVMKTRNGLQGREIVLLKVSAGKPYQGHARENADPEAGAGKHVTASN